MGGLVAFDSGASRRRAWSASGRVSLLLLSLQVVACGDPNPPGPEQWVKSSPGASGSATMGMGPSQPPAPPRSVQGTWAIVAGEMDATVVELDADGNGHGCQAGWATRETGADYAMNYCGPVTGHVDGDHVVFDLALTGMGGLHYSINGTLSDQDIRIGGVHRISEASIYTIVEPGVAIRYARNDEPGPYPLGKPWPFEAMQLVRDQALMTEVQQGPFEPGKRYRLQHAWTTIGGDLGEYLGTELSFDVLSPGNVTLHAGPVPVTVPDMPVALTAHYVNSALSDVTVQMPAGDTFLLTPAPPEP